MNLNINFKDFKKKHLDGHHQIIFSSKKCNDYNNVENLFKLLLVEKNSFIFESVEKGKIRGRYTIIGLNPDKIYDIKKGLILIKSNGNTKKVKGNPLLFLNNLIKKFKIEIPKSLPSMASMLVGYFSYDNCINPYSFSWPIWDSHVSIFCLVNEKAAISAIKPTVGSKSRKNNAQVCECT